jgi:hypothetical protein
VNQLYVIVIWILNATTGEPERQYVSSKPLSIQECAQTLIDRGPVPVKDNQATFMFCQKVGKTVSL